MFITKSGFQDFGVLICAKVNYSRAFCINIPQETNVIKTSFCVLILANAFFFLRYSKVVIVKWLIVTNEI
jgi:hypothetical protein